MPKLKALGGLKLEAAPFTRPTPLLLLAYLSLEGPQQRRHLAELFWPEGNRMKSLSMTLTRLRQGVGEVIEADDKQAKSKLKSDAQTLLETLDKSDWQRAHELYTGAFLEGVILDDWSSELEEWVYTTREYLAERVQYALLNLAENAASEQNFDKTRALAERAYKLPGLSTTDVTHLKRLYPLLCAGRSLFAPEARKELEEFGLALSLTTETAQATFKAIATPKTTLPVRSTTFVGRDEELTKLATLLSKPEVSLLTLLGPAGVGKTRLALQLAHEQSRLDAFEDGVYFVALDALSDTGLIATSLISHLGVSQQGQTEPMSQLISFIAEKQIFMVLDNFEQLTEGSGLLSPLLSQCPNLKLLVTSRQRLKLEEEHLYTLEGLAYPTTASDDASLSEAVQLFRERAQKINPHFELEQNLAEVIRICRLVEGLPLGIELAASWVRLLSCSDIATEIEQGLELLSTDTKNVPERHRSLKATFEQSWKLLSDKEQQVLRKLSVFVGGFRREAASEVAGATIPVLASLVDKSLLKVLPNGRYDRHPLLYQFTREKLTQDPLVEQECRYLHGSYFRHFLLKQSSSIKKNQFQQAFQAIAEDFANLDLAWQWLVSFSDEVAFRNICNVLTRYFQVKGQALLGAMWFERGLSYTDNVMHRTSLLYGLSYMEFRLGRFNNAIDWAKQALGLSEVTAVRSEHAKICRLLGNIFLRLGEYDQAETFLTEGLRLATESTDNHELAHLYSAWAQFQDMRGNFAEAIANYEKAMGMYRQLGDDPSMVPLLNNLGNTHLGVGNLEEAKSLFSEGLRLARKISHQAIIPYFLYNLAVLAKRTSEYDAGFSQCLEALKITRDQGDQSLEASILGMLGVLANQLNQDTQAHEYIVASLGVAQAISDIPVLTENLFYLAELKGKQQQFEQAILIASFVAHYGATTGNNQTMALKFLKNLSTQYPGEMFDHLATSGQTMTLEQILELALKGSGSSIPQARVSKVL